MFDKKNPCVLGKPEVVYVGDNMYGTKYETKFYGNTLDGRFIDNLELLGFMIYKFYFNLIYVKLPIEWKHIRLDKHTEIIIDALGRKRIIIDTEKKTSQILTRYSYVLNILRTNSAVVHVEWTVFDAGNALVTDSISPELYETILQGCGYNENVAIAHVVDVIEEGIALDFPYWKDEIAYW